MKHAIGYIRVSTTEQAADDRYGIEVQKAEIRKYCADKGLILVDWVIDEVSGAKDNRQGLDSLLYEDIDVDAVVVFKNDRLARDTKLYFYYLYVFEKKGVELLSVREDFGENGEFANIYRALLQFVAEQERKNIALRTGKGRRMKAVCGGYSGGRPPYGYKAVDGQLVINEKEAVVVRHIFEAWNRMGKYLCVADELNRQGIRTRTGSVFCASTVKAVINNRRLYEGYYKYGTRDWVKGIHEPILEYDV